LSYQLVNVAGAHRNKWVFGEYNFGVELLGPHQSSLAGALETVRA
jgi:hypothetical protein